MLLLIGILVSTLILGIGIAALIDSKQYLALILPIGFLGFSWISFLLANIFGFNTTAIIIATILSTAIGIIAYFKKSFGLEVQKDTIIVSVISFVVFTTLSSFVLYAGGESLSGFSTDFTFHASLISTIANGNFPPTYPFYLLGEKLNYYYFPHFYVANLMKAGGNLFSLFVIFYIAVASCVVLLYELAKQLSGKKTTAALAVLIFLTFSSFAFFPYFSENQSLLKDPFKILFKPEVSVNSLIYEHGYPIVNTLVNFLITQRSVPVALALILASLLLLVKNNFSKKSIMQSGTVLALSIPIHPFLVVATLAIMCTYLILFDHRKLPFLAPAVILAFALAWFFFSKNNSIPLNYLQINLGWLSQSKTALGIVAFWVANLGFYILPVVIFWKRLPVLLQRILASSLPLFIFLNLITFTPNTYDSGKILIPILAVLSISCAIAIAHLATKHLHLALLFVLVASFFSILLFITVFDHRTDVIFTKGEIDACLFAKSALTDEKMILTSSDDTCIPVIAGKKVFLGQTTALQAHGIDVRLASLINTEMLDGNCDEIKRQKIKYLYDGGRNRLAPVNYTFLTQHGKTIWSDGQEHILELYC